MEAVIQTYRELRKHESLKLRLRTPIRNLVVEMLSSTKKMDASPKGVYFPYYHHVFSDEASGFERQMRFLKNYGDFISMDDAVEAFTSGHPIKDRYFCVSFDDGFASCKEFMLPITEALNIPVLIYLPTEFVGLDCTNKTDFAKATSFNPKLTNPIPFLTWEECKSMLDSGVTFGSHTANHINLLATDDDALEEELRSSKATIEEKLGVTCRHFAPPWGKLDINFSQDQIDRIVKKVGFKSVVTTHRGVNTSDTSPFLIKRDHVLANWSNAQLKYMFGG